MIIFVVSLLVWAGVFGTDTHSASKKPVVVPVAVRCESGHGSGEVCDE